MTIWVTHMFFAQLYPKIRAIELQKNAQICITL